MPVPFVSPFGIRYLIRPGCLQQPGNSHTGGTASRAPPPARTQLRLARSLHTLVCSAVSTTGDATGGATFARQVACTLSFRVSAPVRFTEDVRVVGDCPELGNWDVNLAPSLLLAQDLIYRRLRVLPRGRAVMFKLVKVQDDALEWEDGPNRFIDRSDLQEHTGLLIDIDFGGPMAVSRATDLKMQEEAAAVYGAAQVTAKIEKALVSGTYAVDFVVKEPLPSGRRYRVVGSCEALGDWQLEAAPEMEPSSDNGTGSHLLVALPVGQRVECKLVSVGGDLGDVIWQAGPNVHVDVRVGCARPALELTLDAFAPSSLMSQPAAALKELRELAVSTDTETSSDEDVAVPPTVPSLSMDAMSESIIVFKSMDSDDEADGAAKPRAKDNAPEKPKGSEGREERGKGGGLFAAMRPPVPPSSSAKQPETNGQPASAKAAKRRRNFAGVDLPWQAQQQRRESGSRSDEEGSRWADAVAEEAESKAQELRKAARDAERVAAVKRAADEEAAREVIAEAKRKQEEYEAKEAARKEAEARAKVEKDTAARDKVGLTAEQETRLAAERERREKAVAEARQKAAQAAAAAAEAAARAEEERRARAAAAKKLIADAEAAKAKAAAAAAAAALQARVKEKAAAKAKKDAGEAEAKKVTAKDARKDEKKDRKEAEGKALGGAKQPAAKDALQGDSKVKSAAAGKRAKMFDAMKAASPKKQEAGSKTAGKSFIAAAASSAGGAKASAAAAKGQAKAKEAEDVDGSMRVVRGESARPDGIKAEPWWALEEGKTPVLAATMGVILVASAGLLYGEISLYGMREFKRTMDKPLVTAPAPAASGNAMSKLSDSLVALAANTNAAVSSACKATTDAAAGVSGGTRALVSSTQSAVSDIRSLWADAIQDAEGKAVGQVGGKEEVRAAVVPAPSAPAAAVPAAPVAPGPGDATPAEKPKEAEKPKAGKESEKEVDVGVEAPGKADKGEKADKGDKAEKEEAGKGRKEAPKPVAKVDSNDDKGDKPPKDEKKAAATAPPKADAAPKEDSDDKRLAAKASGPDAAPGSSGSPPAPPPPPPPTLPKAAGGPTPSPSTPQPPPSAPAAPPDAPPQTGGLAPQAFGGPRAEQPPSPRGQGGQPPAAPQRPPSPGGQGGQPGPEAPRMFGGFGPPMRSDAQPDWRGPGGGGGGYSYSYGDQGRQDGGAAGSGAGPSRGGGGGACSCPCPCDGTGYYVPEGFFYGRSPIERFQPQPRGSPDGYNGPRPDQDRQGLGQQGPRPGDWRVTPSMGGYGEGAYGRDPFPPSGRFPDVPPEALQDGRRAAPMPGQPGVPESMFGGPVRVLPPGGPEGAWGGGGVRVGPPRAPGPWEERSGAAGMGASGAWKLPEGPSVVPAGPGLGGGVDAVYGDLKGPSVLPQPGLPLSLPQQYAPSPYLEQQYVSPPPLVIPEVPPGGLVITPGKAAQGSWSVAPLPSPAEAAPPAKQQVDSVARVPRARQGFMRLMPAAPEEEEAEEDMFEGTLIQLPDGVIGRYQEVPEVELVQVEAFLADVEDEAQ